MKTPIITVVGSFVVGITIRTDRMPIFGESLLGSGLDIGPGGKGSNQAVAAARQGAQAHFVGIVGQDTMARIATDLYAAEGVDTRHLQQVSHLPTGVAFIMLNPQGQNGILIEMGANGLMDASTADAAEAQIAASDIVMSVLELPVAAAAQAMALGRKHGKLTILNPAPAAPLAAAVLANVDYLTPNETELRVLMGLAPDDPTPTPELAARLMANGPRNVIVTMGEHGALVLTGEETYPVPGVPVDVVDTTGAGDAFNGGLAVALGEGRPLKEAVQYACCSGALCCTALGVIPGLARRDAVDALYARHFGG